MAPNDFTGSEPSSTDSSESPNQTFSYVSPIGYFKSSRCGYCGRDGASQSQRFSYYAGAISLTPEFYKTLLDRYWRRSGTLLYRPDQRRACCPHYTIRLDSSTFKPTKDQRQATNRFNRYVLGDHYIKEAARRHPRSKAETKRRDTVFDLPERIHECEDERVPRPPEPAHQFTVTLEEDTFTEEKYLIFANYQRVVHHEDDSRISRQGFTRFLCDSPVVRQTTTLPDGTVKKYGSFHQCYRLDGKLVAVGVLDLVPGGVSAVYFFYHESLHPYSPGKLSALREISLAMEADYRYWYPGFYIHSCPKMRYKMDYKPQYILDPETLEYDLVDDEVMVLLAAKPYLSLSRERRLAVQRRDTGDQDDANKADPDANKADPDANSKGDDAKGPDAEDNDGDSDGIESMWLFDSGMPGIPSLRDMMMVDLDRIGVRVGGSHLDGYYTTSDLTCWLGESITDYGGFKASVAELVAAIGPDQVGNIRLAERLT